MTAIKADDVLKPLHREDCTNPECVQCGPQTPFQKMLAKSPRDRQVGGSHYSGQAVQKWDVIDTWPIEQQIGYHRGEILGYIMRLGVKPSAPALEDAEKIAHCAEKLVEVLKGVQK